MTDAASSPGMTVHAHELRMPDGRDESYFAVGADDAPRLVVGVGASSDVLEAATTHADEAFVAWNFDDTSRDMSERAHAVDVFIRALLVARGRRPENLAVAATGVDAAVVCLWLHDYAPRLRAVVLAHPELNESPACPDGFTYAVRRIKEDADAIRCPIRVLASSSDSAASAWMKELGSKDKKLVTAPGAAGSADSDFASVWSSIFDVVHTADWIDPPEAITLRDAHEQGKAKDEHDRLARPMRPLSGGWFNYGARKLFLRTVGKLSHGVSIGWATGFDSGETLDYVYANEVHGALGIGKIIDRRFLDTVAWRAIRQRRVNVTAAVEDAIRRVAASGVHPVHVVDIAAGVGRYVLDAIANAKKDVEVTAELRDFNPGSVAAGRELVQELGLDGVTFEKGHAFDPNQLTSFRPRPHVAVASGLYELFSDNRRVMKSLRALGQVVEDGGFLVYTGQPWHPHIEILARVLNRPGDVWIMRRRYQLELDELVAEAGFEKIGQTIGKYGIFTVSTAMKS